MDSALPKLSNYQFVGHTDGISCLSLGSFGTPFHNTIASGGYDGQVKLWDTRLFGGDENRQRESIGTIDTAPASNNGTITAIVFGEASLPYTCEQPTRLLPNPLNNYTQEKERGSQIAQNWVSSGNYSPILTQHLFETNQNSIFCAVDNVVYQYDLRMLGKSTSNPLQSDKNDPSTGALSQHIGISNEFGDSIGFLTLTPDGKNIAMCTDDNQIHFVPLNDHGVLQQCVDSELLKFAPPNRNPQILKYNPNISSPSHENIPTSLSIDTFDPIRLTSLANNPTEPHHEDQTKLDRFYNSYSTYSGGMDFHLVQHSIPHTADLLKVLSPSQFAPTKRINVNQSGMSGQISNPPFINAATISPNSSSLLYALGDGTFACFAIERETYLPFNSIYQETTAKSANSRQKNVPLSDYITYIDAAIGMYTSGRSFGMFHAHDPTFLGQYRGHMHSVVGINCPSFLNSNLNSSMLSKLWLSTISQSAMVRNQFYTSASPRANNPYFFSKLFQPPTATATTTQGEKNEFFSASECETFSSLLRTTFSQQYSPQYDGVSGYISKGKPLFNFNRDFSDINHFITVSLDQTLILWKGVGDASRIVYNVARSQSIHNSETSAKPPQKKKNTKDSKPAPQPVDNRYQYSRLVQNVLMDVELDKAGLVEQLSKIKGSNDGTNIDDDYDIIDHYNRQNLESYRESIKNAKTGQNLIEGMYKKLLPEQAAVLDTDHIQLRIPLASKPNALVTDRVGHAYIADTTKKISVIALLKD